jgi:ribonuclease HII
VVAAAVVLDPKRIPKGIDDSKRLTAERREELFEEICATASFAVAFASPARIDRDNILRASLWALARAVHALPEMPKHVFVDGRDRLDTPCDCDAVIGGDGLVLSIAAASIIAKVARDRLMCKLAQDCPGYGFESHKGYGVPEHLAALTRLGPTVHHRRFFAPVVAAREKHEAKKIETTIKPRSKPMSWRWKRQRGRSYCRHLIWLPQQRPRFITIHVQDRIGPACRLDQAFGRHAFTSLIIKQSAPGRSCSLFVVLFQAALW